MASTQKFRSEMKADITSLLRCGSGLDHDAANEIDRLRLTIERLESDVSGLLTRIAASEAVIADEETLRNQMAHLLHRTAIALRGPESEGMMWGWADLPERAAAIVESARAVIERWDVPAWKDRKNTDGYIDALRKSLDA